MDLNCARSPKQTAILGVEIWTSKSGRLWPTEYWKSLIDALGSGGAKYDPRLKYPELARQLDAMVEVRSARYYPKAGTVLAIHEDTALRLMLVHRAETGDEGVVLGRAGLPNTECWVSISFPFFGTIGDTRYEVQSKLNRDAIAEQLKPQLREIARSSTLCLSFELSANRRDRDLDNLADALMPLFNRHSENLDHMCLVKASGASQDTEVLRIACDPDALAGAKVSAL
jgi:hypothetical protein